MARKRISAEWVIEGAIDGDAFEIYLREVLGPTLKAGNIGVMDNLRVHKVASVEVAINGCGARVGYLPPYSPDYNPIEKCWSKIKTAVLYRKTQAGDGISEPCRSNEIRSVGISASKKVSKRHESSVSSRRFRGGVECN
jgi:transposase